MTNIEHNTVVALVKAMQRLHEKELEMLAYKADGQPGNVDRFKLLKEDAEASAVTVRTCLQILEIQ